MRRDLAEWAPCELCKELLTLPFSAAVQLSAADWPIKFVLNEQKVLLEDEPVVPAAKLQHELWERMQNASLQNW